MPEVSIVIPVYNSWKLARKNVEALLHFDRDAIDEIILVDDCSPIANAETFDPLVCIIRNDRNLGYAGTVNNGLRKAKNNCIVLLDSDAYILHPITEKILRHFEDDALVGCIGFKSVAENGKVTGSILYAPTLLGYILGQQLESKFISTGLLPKSKILPLSCCVAFRKQCLEEMDYFDEKNFPVLEADNDLGLRIHQSQWKIIYDDNIVVCHEGGKSYKINSKRVRMYHESKWVLLRKHGQIKYVSGVRGLLNLRVSMEILLLRGLRFLHKKNPVYEEKLAGRKALKEDIKSYT